MALAVLGGASLGLGCSGRVADGGLGDTNAGKAGERGAFEGVATNVDGPHGSTNSSGGHEGVSGGGSAAGLSDGGRRAPKPDGGARGPLTISERQGDAQVEVLQIANGAAAVNIRDVAIDRDGNAWFTSSESIGRVTPSGVATLYPVPARPAPGLPLFIVAGTDGDLWFSRGDGSTIGRVTTSGVITEFPLPPLNISWNGGGSTLAPGLHGLWFSAEPYQYIGNMNVSGAVTQRDVALSYGTAMAVSKDDAVWFDSTVVDDHGQVTYQVSRFHDNGAVETFRVPSVVLAMAVDRYGALWFAETEDDWIGRLSPNGDEQQIHVHARRDGAATAPIEDITVGPDGNIWFVEQSAPSIAKVDVETGVISHYSVADPTCGACVTPMRLAVDPEGVVWFTRSVKTGVESSDTLGRLTLSSTESPIIIQ